MDKGQTVLAKTHQIFCFHCVYADASGLVHYRRTAICRLKLSDCHRDLPGVLWGGEDYRLHRR